MDGASKGLRVLSRESDKLKCTQLNEDLKNTDHPDKNRYLEK
jgi:hypothetical protein